MRSFLRTLHVCFLVVSFLPAVVLSHEDGGGDGNSISSTNEIGQETIPRDDSAVTPSPVDVSQFKCSAETQCTLEIGEAFGNPWIKTKAKDVNYFQVMATRQMYPTEVIATAMCGGKVEMYASKGGTLPTLESHDWSGGNVLRLTGLLPAKEKLIVMVVSPDDVSYRMLASSIEDVLRLEDGRTVEMVQDEDTMRYFSIEMTTSNTDLSVATNPIYGDPDIYVSPLDPEGRILPSKHNYTWHSLNFGSDTLEIQAEALSQYCTPDDQHNCTYTVGVEAVSNCSYFIQASLNHGWETPRTLIMGQVQRAHLKEQDFHYYSLSLGKPPDEPPGPMTEPVIVTLTPLDGGSQDMYLTTDRNREPGPNDYDVKGSDWGGSTTIPFSKTSAGYCKCAGTGEEAGEENTCSECFVYVSVFGFKRGDYMIVASEGLTHLQEGLPQHGTLSGASTSQFYEFFNPKGNGDSVQVSLTALSGDPDVYISTAIDELPGPTNSDWVGGALGSDTVLIQSSDSKFCENCVYFILVTSDGNASYTISASRQNGGVITLVPGRPQAGAVRAGEMKYYTVRSQSDTAKLIVSFTSRVGVADLYIRIGAGLIDPEDVTTYSSTARLSTLSPQHESYMSVEGATDDVVIGMFGVSDTKFSFTASFDQAAKILSSGIPERHFVKAGQNSYFDFLVDQANSEVQLSLMPIGGRPMLYAGMRDEVPSCVASKTSGVGMDCSGWTWALVGGGRGSITIDPADPCAKPSANSTEVPSKMVVANDCSAKDFKMGMMHLTVAAAPDADTWFYVAALSAGKHLTLVPGAAQHTTTSMMIPCGGLLPNPCAPRRGTEPAAEQQALFTFKVLPGSVSAEAGVSLNLVPDCPPGGGEGAHCPYGCPCRPAEVFIKSCVEGRCQPTDRFPGPGNADKEFEVSSANGAVFIAEGEHSAGDGVFCSADDNHVCVFYVAVMAGGEGNPPIGLTATAITPEAVVVLPCVSSTLHPDGLLHSIATSGEPGVPRRYELCVPSGKNVQVSMERCNEGTELYMCDSTCPHLFPEDNEYTQMSDGEHLCAVAHSQAGPGRPQCKPREDGVYVRTDRPKDEPDATFFLSTYRDLEASHEVDTRDYILTVEELGYDGIPRAPRLQPNAHPSAAAMGAFSIAAVTGAAATVEWGGATLLFPANEDLPAAAGERDCSMCIYDLYAVPKTLTSWKTSPYTRCGLENLLVISSKAQSPEVVHEPLGRLERWGDSLYRAVLGGLQEGTEYEVIVVAECDIQCLMKHLPMMCDRRGHPQGPCSSQYTVFPPAALTASLEALPRSEGEGPAKNSGGDASGMSPAVLVVATIASAGLAAAVFSLIRRAAQASVGVGDMTMTGRGGGRGADGDMEPVFQAGGTGVELANLRHGRPSSEGDDGDEFAGKMSRVGGKGGYASLLAEHDES